MYEEFKELLSIFNAHGIKYLVVGGYAVGLHSQPRATKDIDLWIRPDAENAKAVYTALAEFGAPLEGITAAEFTEPGMFFRLGSPPLMVDILPQIAGIDFDTAWERRVEAVIDDLNGSKALFVSETDLVASKLAAARPQDLADVDAIRKAAIRRGSRK